MGILRTVSYTSRASVREHITCKPVVEKTDLIVHSVQVKSIVLALDIHVVIYLHSVVQ